MSSPWHIECLVCEALYYTADYPRKGCRKCGRDALLITDHRVDHRVDRRVNHEHKEDAVGSYRFELTSES